VTDEAAAPVAAGRAREDSVEIRPVTLHDLDSLVEIYLAGARHHAAIDPAAFRVPDRSDVADRLRRRLDASGPEHAYIAADLAGRLVGSATLDVDDVPSPGAMTRPMRSAELGIAILDDWRGRGIGHRLIAALEDWAAEHGIDRVRLNVTTTNAGAIRLYRGLGYEDSGIEMRKDVARR
jgi:ribosomal protein S18 acetylase RimI-like enzyme